MPIVAADTRPTSPLRSETTLRVLYALAALAVVIVVAFWTDTTLSLPITKSDDCLWGAEMRNGEPVLVVAKVFEGGAAERGGIREGDRVIAINGVTIGPEQLQPLAAQKILNDAPAGEPIPYVVERDGRQLHYLVTLSRLFPTALLTFPIFALLWLGISLVTVMAQPRGSVQRLFFLTGLSVFFLITTANTLNVMVLSAWSLIGASFLGFWVLFCDRFPTPQRIFTGRHAAIPFLLSLGGALLILVPFWSHLDNLQALNATWYTHLTSAAVIVYAVAFAVGIVLLFRGYLLMPAGPDRVPMRIILIGTLISSAVLVYISVIARQEPLLGLLKPQFFLPALFIVALPVSFGYGVLKYQLMDVRAVVKTALVYSVSTGVMLALYMTTARLIGYSLGSLSGEGGNRTVEIAVIAIFILLFEPVRRSVRGMIDKRFFPDYRDYSAHLSDYAVGVTRAIDVKGVAELIAETLRQHLKVDVVCIATINRDGALAPVAGSCMGNGGFTEEERHGLRRVLSASRELVPLTAQEDPALAPLLAQGYTKAIGLYAGDRLIGSILVGKRSDKRSISGGQISFIKGVASQGASGIEAARLYERESERRRYEEELATARRIQQSLLPSTMPSVPGVAISALSYPAQEVGGDYYEIVPLPGDRMLAMIADVSGKGLPAALYMAELHGMMRMVATMQGSPGSMLTVLNERLCEVMERKAFITATIALFDLERGIVTVARAGQTRLMRMRDGRVETFAPQGLPLGIRALELFASSIEEITLDLLPGDRFILYSDGVSEAMNGRREEFGEERLRAAVAGAVDASPDKASRTLLRTIAAFRGDAEQNDDITVVVVDVEEESVQNFQFKIQNEEGGVIR